MCVLRRTTTRPERSVHLDSKHLDDTTASSLSEQSSGVCGYCMTVVTSGQYSPSAIVTRTARRGWPGKVEHYINDVQLRGVCAESLAAIAHMAQGYLAPLQGEQGYVAYPARTGCADSMLGIWEKVARSVCEAANPYFGRSILDWLDLRRARLAAGTEP